MPSASLPEGFDPFAGAQLLSAVPSTEPQREVWTSSQISQDANLAYNESVSVVLDGPLNDAALESALKQLIQRHEALRSTFSADGEKLLVNANADVPLERIDLSTQPESTRASKLAAHLQKVVTTPFDLATGPLARAELLKLSPTRHQLVFTAHHIVCDGWSAAVLVKDWGILYSAQAQGQKPDLPQADPFSGYAAELAKKESTSSPALVADEAYWTNRFAGEPPVLELPTDRPRPPLKTYASRREDAVIPEELVTRIRKAGSKERVSLFAMLLAGFQALLARLSNQNDVVVGIPVAGQAAEGHQELVGHAVSMLPIRTQLDPTKPLKALLADARTNILEAQEHQSFTIGSLLKKLPIKRDPSRLPLMSVIFNVDRGVGPSGLPFSGLAGTLAGNPRAFETYELFVNAVELGGKITVECQYNTDLFERSTIQRWLAAYERLLRGMAQDLESQQGTALGALPLLSDDEVKQLDAWNAASALPVDPAARVHDLIAAQVRKTPDKAAIHFEGKPLTYQQWDARANALATKLRGLGVKRGQRVGLAVERSPEMLVGLYGILKSGAGYVPLDPGYPKDRLAFMVEDGQLDVVVTQKSVATELELKAKHLVLVEELPAEAPPLAPSADDAQVEDVCYVIYTSGSTGKPKGVQVPHRSVVNIVASCQKTPGLTEQDTVLAVTTLSFDIAVSELILPFTVGATVEIASREVASDGGRLLALLKSSGATFMDATPATYRLLLSAGWTGGDLKRCVCTGEAMPKDLAIELVKRVPSVWNGYGPTETTVWSTFYEVKAPVEKILIGTPVANTQLYILDAQRQRAPLGVIGELYIGGRGVTLGYLGRPELTKDRFVPNPFGEGMLYRTGDLVRYQRDGNVECLGRNDNQVKVRGFRIELGEIEDQLTQHPAVKQAAVIAREFKADDVRLVGYVVQHVGQSVTDSDLRAHLKKTLPEYMVPAHLVKLDRMPLTPSGKIDRKALPAPDTSAGLSDAYVAPRTDTERGLAEIWQQILALGRVGATDDFFALGGHSLLASQLLSRVRQRFGAQLSFRKIFEAPTVEKLAKLVDASKGTAEAGPTAIPKRPAGNTAPLSVSQARLVLLEEMDPGTRQVHALCAKWRLGGALNLDAIRKAFAALVARHETLRSTLRVEAGGRQVVMVSPDRQLRLDELDVSALPPSGQDDRAIAVLQDYGMRPFDLDWEPPIRLMLMKRSEKEHELLLCVHNFAWDGWSFDLFLKDMSALYVAFAQGKPNPLPPLPVSYYDFSVWQQQFLASDEVERQAKFWQEKLKEDVPPLDFPTDSPRQGSRSSAGANEGIEIAQELQDALVALAQREGTTLFAVVFAAFSVILARLSGQRDMLVGVPTRARSRPELEDVIGPFTNNVLLRTQLDDKMTFLQLLHATKEQILDAFSNQDVPVERLGIKPPLVRAFFSLQDARGRPTRFGDLEVKQLHTRPPNAANEMMLWTMQRNQGGLLAMLNYSTDLYKPESMRRLLRQLETLLGEVLKDPNRPALHMPILPDDERKQLADWADPGEEGANTLFEGLEQRSSALAKAAEGWARLVAQKGGRGKAVAVKLPPSPERAAAVLGVLRAGGVLAALGPAEVEIKPGETPLNLGDPGPEPAGDAPALRAGETTVSHRLLARSFLSLAGRAGIAALDNLWDGIEVGQDAWWMPALLAGASGAATGGARPTVVLAHSANMAELHAKHPDAKLLCTGHPSKKLSAALAARLAPAFAVLVPEAVGVPVAAGRVETRRDGRALFGRPLSGVPVRVLDAGQETAPINAPGRLVMGDTATSERVRFLADDTLEHLGWLDGQVQFRGRPTPIDKMAKAMASHAGVADAAVRCLTDKDGEEKLVAYVAGKTGEMFTETELRTLSRKATGVTPQIFIELESMPKTPKGTVDDDKLPSPFARTGGHEFQPARTASEKLLAGLWQKALQLPRVGVYENFFDLGGYSLLCFQVLGEVKSQTGASLSPRTMLLGTLEQVAAELDQAASAAKGPNAVKSAAGPAASAPPSEGGGLLDRLRGWAKP